MTRSKFYLISNYFSGVGAAHNMLADAIEQKRSFIEQVCLSATLIDGLLRLSLVMKQQLDTNKAILDRSLLYQGKRKKAKSIHERKVYERASTEKIITKAICKELNFLFDQRNIIAHRYLVSDIKTKDVIKVAKRYIKMYGIIMERHRVVHNKLVSKNIGMARLFINAPSIQEIHKQIMWKHY